MVKTRFIEYRDEVVKVRGVIAFTRGNRKASDTERHESAIVDHVVKENHVIDWDSVRIVAKEK